MFSKMKYYFMVFILMVFAPSFVAADNIDQEDLAFIFGDMTVEQTLELDQMELLSSQEMMETEGEVLPLIFLSARLGYSAYRGYKAYRNIKRVSSLAARHNAYRSLKGFTKHGLHQVASGRLSNRALHHTLKRPGPRSMSYLTGARAGTTRYYGRDSIVVLNRQGRLVTGWNTRTMR
jgi:hypothetical protein